MNKQAKRFQKAQEQRKWTNDQAAEFFDCCSQTISNWRNGRQTIPSYVWKLLSAPAS